MIPIGDTARRETFPIVNYALILANVAVFLYEVTLGAQVDAFFASWAVIPADLAEYVESPDGASRQVLFTPITSMFIHGGWLHLAGNMLYLWIFGDNVEDALGHLGYLVFYGVAGLGALAAQVAVDPNAGLPVVGASGAIAGVLGAYVLLYPKAMVVVTMPFLFFLTALVPALIVIGLWFVVQLLNGLAAVGTAVGAAGGIAWFAHLGGFATGLLLVALFPKRRPRRGISPGPPEGW